MLRLSNISIGIKLGIMSGLGVLLVAAMIATQMWGGAAVSSATEKSNERLLKALDLSVIKGFGEVCRLRCETCGSPNRPRICKRLPIAWKPSERLFKI